MSKGLLERSRYLLIWLGVLPLVLAIVAYRTSSQHIASVNATLDADAFIRNLDELLSSVQAAETGQRGYLLTHSLSYLAPYNDARETLQRDLQNVADYASRDPASTHAVNELRAAIDSKMAELARTIELRDKQGFDAALAEVETDRGRREMDRIRDVIRQLREQQIGIFNRSRDLQARRQRNLDLVLGIGVVLSLLLLFFAYRFSERYGRERDQVEREIRLLNNSLESRVADRTAELEERTRELEARTAELQKSNADLTQFAYVASHDLQEPLRMVGSYMGLLARRYGSELDDDARKYIQFAIDGAQRMHALIQDLLLYSRAGTQPLQKRPFPSQAAVENAVHNLSIAIRESSAKVSFADLPPVCGDELKLTQVFQNLIGNAIKFSKPGVSPEIKISAKRAGAAWEFAVADNGIGFDPKYCDRIFEVFQRLHGVGRYPGNGIGLSICRRIVEHHGGQLRAESTPGAGSIFFFTLPFASIPTVSESREVEVSSST